MSTLIHYTHIRVYVCIYIYISNTCANYVATPSCYTICEACVASGGDSDALVLATQKLTSAIAAYRQASKSAKGLSAKPSSKAKAKASAKVETTAS